MPIVIFLFFCVCPILYPVKCLEAIYLQINNLVTLVLCCYEQKLSWLALLDGDWQILQHVVMALMLIYRDLVMVTVKLGYSAKMAYFSYKPRTSHGGRVELTWPLTHTIKLVTRAWKVVSLPGNALQKANLPASISPIIVTVSLFRDINYINDSCLGCK